VLRLYALAAAALLAASSLTWILLGDEGGTLLTITGVLFWVSGLALIAIGLVVLGRFLGVGSGRGRQGSTTERESSTGGSDGGA
jgi:hypothetical protein